MRVLTLVDFYLPGYKSGGPVRSVSNLVAQMPDRYKFFLLTRDRDHCERTAYEGIVANQWTTVGRAQVMYLTPRSVSIRNLARLVRQANPDVVYANSLFSKMTIRYLVARRLGLVPARPFVLAPRGELSPGAIRSKYPKYLKKVLFLRVAGTCHLLSDLVWQASTDLERQEILDVLRLAGAGASRRIATAVAIARDPLRGVLGAKRTRPPKVRGAALFVFVSRVSPKKNLDLAINLLAGIRGEVAFDIFGPVDDEAYWRRCQAAIARLPRNVRVAYRGAIPHEQIAAAFSDHHFFVFPTKSENFGHVVAEALLAGCPPVMSDTTPWRSFEQQGCGWNLALEDLGAWQGALQRCVDMNSEDYATVERNALHAAGELVRTDEAIEQNVRMFDEAAEGLLRGEDGAKPPGPSP